METSNWVLGDMAWVIIGGAVVTGLLVLNAYFQKLARIEELQRIERLNRERSAASQSRLSDDI
jgi:hypothetical protein